MRIRLRYIAALLLIGAVAAGVNYARTLNAAWSAPGPLAAETLVYIPPGTGGKAVAARLKENGIIEDPLAFRILSRIHRINGSLKTGEYKFIPHMPIADVIALLQSGRTYQHMLTIPEGLMSSEIAALVNGAAAMTGTADAPPEGSVLPETYSYSYGDSRAALVDRMRRAMQDTLGALWQARDPDIPLRSPGEAETLASIVEKETGIPAERPRVAGVFYNRLKSGIPLQSDPTVAYAATGGRAKLDHGLTRSELEADSPYNTYLHAGLPPGPIANPGRAALEAVLHPEKNNYLYFVADGSGGHAFAATLAEHNRNVGNWRKIEKQVK
jgi:UPF0755 protein